MVRFTKLLKVDKNVQKLINNHEFHTIFWEGYSLYNRWDDLIYRLSKNYTYSYGVVLFPAAPVQLNEE